MIFGKSGGETTIGTVANDHTGHRTASVTDLKPSSFLLFFFNKTKRIKISVTQLFPENLTINGTVNNDRISHRTMVRRENQKHQRELNDHHGTVGSPSQ